jgi:hypothetical protein
MAILAKKYTHSNLVRIGLTEITVVQYYMTFYKMVDA